MKKNFTLLALFISLTLASCEYLGGSESSVVTDSTSVDSTLVIDSLKVVDSLTVDTSSVKSTETK
jgi:hypothetical protein